MSRIGLTIKSTELRPGEVMRATHIARAHLWSPEDGLGWWFVDGCRDMPGADGVPAWPLCERPDVTGTIIAVDVPADAEALAAVCRREAPIPAELPATAPVDEILGCSYGASDSLLIAALRAHPDPLGLLARAKIAGPWQEHEERNYWMRVSVADERVAAGASAQRPGADCAAEDARLLADGWRLL